MRHWVMIYVMVALVVGGCGSRTESEKRPDLPGQTSVAPEQTAAVPGQITPAWLTSFYFLDPEHGWLTGIQRGCGNGGLECRGLILYTSQLRQSDGKLLHTTDGGRSWQPLYTALGGAFLSVQFVSPEQGWLTNTHGELFRSSDGGRSWAPANVQCIDWVSFVDARNGYGLCGFPRNPGPGMSGKSLLRTEDGGEHWSVVQRVGEPADRQPGGLLHTLDGGKTWRSLLGDRSSRNLPPVEGEIDYSEARAVQFFTEANGYVLTHRYLMETDDGGRTWQIIYNPNAAP